MKRFTLGVEEEYQLCDPRTGGLTPAVERVLDAASPELRERLGYELLQTVLEGNIPVACDLDMAAERVRDLRCAVIDLAEANGIAIGIGGVHPFADWRDQGFVDTEAYRWVGNQLQNVARRNLSFGMHVHVHVEDDDARTRVCNEMRRWASPILSLSANAPFFEGADTGFQTIRMHVFGSFPRTGFPPPFRDWAHHQRVIERLIASEAITKPRQVWWNVRPHVAYRTVELRMIDMQISPARTRAFTALSQAVVAALLERAEAGEPEWEMEPAFLADGWFKAQRFRWDAKIAHPVTGETTTLLAEIEAMLESARPWAERLGTAADAIGGIERILDEGPEADWQRAAYEEAGRDLGALQRRIIDRVKDEAGCPKAAAASAD